VGPAEITVLPGEVAIEGNGFKSEQLRHDVLTSNRIKGFGGFSTDLC
jgi:hypothetical protein